MPKITRAGGPSYSAVRAPGRAPAVPRSAQEDAPGPQAQPAYESVPVVPPDYAALTKLDLQLELDLRNLPRSGTKDELIARLQDSDK